MHNLPECTVAVSAEVDALQLAIVIECGLIKFYCRCERRIVAAK